MQLRAYTHPLLLSEYEYIFVLNEMPAPAMILGLNLTDPGQSVSSVPHSATSHSATFFSDRKKKMPKQLSAAAVFSPLDPLKRLQITYMTLPVNQDTNG